MKTIAIAFLISCLASLAVAQTRTHVVKRGETYQSIAEKYGISEENLKSYNATHPSCYVGLKINVPFSNEAYSPAEEPENEYDKFIRIAKEAVEGKDLESAYQLAKCYEQGQGTDKDEEQAVVWYQFGHTKNHVPSSLELARCLENGVGVKANAPQALRIYGDLAVKENSSACSHLRSHGYEERTWPFLAQYGEVPKFVKEKWEAEARRQEAERKRQEAERKRQEAERQKQEAARQKQQLAVLQNAQPAQPAQQRVPAPQTSYSSANVAVSQPARRPDWSVKTGLYETVFHDNGDGTVSTITKSACVGCWGRGLCDACKYISIAPQVYGGVCPMCHGTRVCQKCYGKRYMMSYGKIDNAGNGYCVGEDGSMGFSGGSGGGSSYSSSGSSSSSSHSSSYSSRSTCPKCNGRRFESQSFTYASSSAAGWMQPYHNSGGSNCQYCSSASDHYHYPCSECRGYGQVKN